MRASFDLFLPNLRDNETENQTIAQVFEFAVCKIMDQSAFEKSACRSQTTVKELPS